MWTILCQAEGAAGWLAGWQSLHSQVQRMSEHMWFSIRTTGSALADDEANNKYFKCTYESSTCTSIKWHHCSKEEPAAPWSFSYSPTSTGWLLLRCLKVGGGNGRPPAFYYFISSTEEWNKTGEGWICVGEWNAMGCICRRVEPRGDIFSAIVKGVIFDTRTSFILLSLSLIRPEWSLTTGVMAYGQIRSSIKVQGDKWLDGY